MDNLDETENNAKVFDSAYSNSCSNSQSRKSSTHSGSHSSRSSGYGGKQSICGSRNHLSKPAEKRIKDNDRQKKKHVQNKLVQIQAGVEFRLPKPALACEVKEEVSDALPSLPILAQAENGVKEDYTVAVRKSRDNIVTSNALQSPVQTVMCEPRSSDGFLCVISMHDGIVIYTTSLPATLGFPKDMWIGRSFIDFIHPLDHSTFASQITSGFATPKKVNLNSALDAVQSSGNNLSTMFCRIRQYRGLPSGFGVKDRTISFMPFMLKLSFKNISVEQGVVICLVIQATPLFSAFKTGHEIVAKPVPFVMRHLSNGTLEYIDHQSVSMLGYLPQDVTGKDVLRLYHPDDLVYLRQLYETIVREGGAPRSKQYRLMAQNGHYLKLETEWSSFINPWSRKLEFVVGKHHVVEGPGNPNVFQPPIPEKTSDQEKNKVQGLRDSIIRVMNEVLMKPAEIAKQQMTKRCQDLAIFMESLIEEPPKMEEELRLEMQDNENSYYERDSVMLGGISPHHDYNDSTSTTTHLSYNQLNFNENLQRYFNSHQPISYDEYRDTPGNDSVTTKYQSTFSGGCTSPMAQQFGDSAELTSSGESTGAMFGEESSKRRLTESVLNKHNTEMEKSLVMQHRECRQSNKESREKVSIGKQNKKDHLTRCNASFVPPLEGPRVDDSQPHGLKRASKQCEAKSPLHKHHCVAPRNSLHRPPPAAPMLPPSKANSASQWQQSSTGMNQFMSNIGMSQPLPLMNSMTAVPGLIPMYYVPAAGPTMPSISEMSIEAKTTTRFPVPHLQCMMYGQALFGSPLLVSSINPQVTYPIQQPLQPYSATQHSLGLTTRNHEEAQACEPGMRVKPGNSQGIELLQEKTRAAESLATTSKVSPGRGNSSSNCSTYMNRSTELPDSTNSRNSKMKTSGTDEESNYSSFYSSCLKTDSGSAEDSCDAKKNKNESNLGSKSPCYEYSRNKNRRKTREPPWMEQVCFTSELIYKYQISNKNISEVLIADKEKMISLQQPSLVNDQLGQLYMDMDLEGVAARLTLEEGVTSSSSSGEEHAIISKGIITKRSRRKRQYSKLVMVYEEDAPLPPPCGDTGELEVTEPATPLV